MIEHSLHAFSTKTGRPNGKPSRRAVPQSLSFDTITPDRFLRNYFGRWEPRLHLLGKKSSSWGPRVKYSLKTIYRIAGLPRDYGTDARQSRPNGRFARLLGNKPTRIYMPLLVRPWVKKACHADASCHLGTSRTLAMLERIYWQTGMEACARW